MSEEKKYGIKETKDLFTFLTNYALEMKKHKSDDGKIDTQEMLEALGEVKDDAIKATMGIWHIGKEARDLDQEEKDELIAMSLDFATACAEVFLGIEIDRNPEKKGE